jgi:hypothetical protein
MFKSENLKRRGHLVDHGVEILLKWILKKMVEGSGLDSSAPG